MRWQEQAEGKAREVQSLLDENLALQEKHLREKADREESLQCQEQSYRRQVAALRLVKARLVEKLEELKQELANIKSKNAKMK